MVNTFTTLITEQQLREMNEALLVSSVRQHELVEQAEQANSALQESERRFRAMIDSLPAATYTTDAEGRLTHFNRAAALFAGRTPKLGTEKWCVSSKLFRADGTLLPLSECPMAVTLKEGREVRGEQVIAERPDGTRRWAETYPTLLRDATGRIVGGINMLVDITERKLAEVALSTSELRYRRLFESSRDGILILDNDTARIIDANPFIGELLGYSQAELIGKELWEIGLFKDEEASKAAVRGLQEQKVIRYEDMPLETKAGQRIEVEFVSNVYGERGRQFIQCNIRDITERRVLQDRVADSEERFRNMADNIPQLAWIADAGTEGQVHWFNKTWFDYTGTTLKQMNGQGWHAVLHPDHAERVLRKLSLHLREGLDWEDTFPLRGIDGNYRWFLSRMKVIRNESGKVVRIFGTNTDITEQRQMAEDLRQNAADMSEADHRKTEFIAMLAHELRNPLAPIRNALQMLRHTTIQERAASSDETVHSAFDMMGRQVAQMVRLVDDLLDVSRISRGRIELRAERVELAPIVAQAVEAARPAIQEVGHELTVTLPSDPVYLHADAARLAQVVGNLLSNACKFTDPGGRIELVVSVENSGEWGVASGEQRSGERRVISGDQSDTCSRTTGISHLATGDNGDGGATLSGTQGLASGDEPGGTSGKGRVASGEQSDASSSLTKHHSPLAAHHSPLATSSPLVTIRVRDNGIGMKAAGLSRIFDMFTQLDTSLERSVSGLGIGLALVKSLVEMHGGTVEVQSAGLGQGSEFIVRLPVLSGEWRVASDEQLTTHHSPLTTSSLTTHHSPLTTSLRVLVVDDNRDSAESLALLLQLFGHETQTAFDGLAAVAAAATFAPDVVLLDIGLPKLNGYEAARRMRELPGGQNLLLVALTGWGQEEDRRKSREAGFNTHLVKPVDLDALEKLLADQLSPQAS